MQTLSFVQIVRYTYCRRKLYTTITSITKGGINRVTLNKKS